MSLIALKLLNRSSIFMAADPSIDVVDPNGGVLLGGNVASNETMNSLVATPGRQLWYAGQ